MTRSRRESYDWHEDADALVAPRVSPEPLPALPLPFEQIGWGTGILAFSCLWMYESWTRSMPGQFRFGDVTESLWTLLLSLAICFGIYKFTRAQRKPFGHVLCILSAAILLLNHIVTS